jgi:hypothetical protein
MIYSTVSIERLRHGALEDAGAGLTMKAITAIPAVLSLALFAGTASAQWTENWDSFLVDTDVTGGEWGGGTSNGSVARDAESISPSNSVAGAGGGNAVRSSMFRSVSDAEALEFSWRTADHGVGFSSVVDVAMTSGQNWDATWGTLLPDYVAFFGENRAGGQVFASLNSGGTIASWDISAAIVADTWYDMKIELLPGDRALWSYKEHASGTWIVNPSGSVPTPAGFEFNYVGISSYSEGNNVYVDDVKVPARTVEYITQVEMDGTLGTIFNTESNETYRLQATPDLVSSNYTDTGAIAIGDGATMTLFDPAGPSASKNYRVTQD